MKRSRKNRKANTRKQTASRSMDIPSWVIASWEIPQTPENKKYRCKMCGAAAAYGTAPLAALRGREEAERMTEFFCGKCESGFEEELGLGSAG